MIKMSLSSDIGSVEYVIREMPAESSFLPGETVAEYLISPERNEGGWGIFTDEYGKKFAHKAFAVLRDGKFICFQKDGVISWSDHTRFIQDEYDSYLHTKRKIAAFRAMDDEEE